MILALATMPLPRLTLWIRDTRTGATMVRSFYRSPVTIGRSESNALRLRAQDIARYHGAFLLGGPALNYVDLGSKGGTKLEGVDVRPDLPVDVEDMSTVSIGPFDIRAQFRLMDLAEGLAEEGPKSARKRNRRRSPESAMVPEEDQWPLSQIAFRWGPLALLTRALHVIEILACAIVEARQAEPTWPSPLRAVDDPEKIIEYLIDPRGGDERLDELIDYLGELLRQALPPTH